MRLSGIGIGLLINFNVLHLRDGIKRMVDGHESPVFLYTQRNSACSRPVAARTTRSTIRIP
jgi:hypothetical protein